MPGFGNAGAPSTAYRRTEVVFDDFLPMTVQPPINLEHPAEAIGQTKDSKKTNVHLLQGIGWQLRAYVFKYGLFDENEEAQDGTYSVALGRSTAAGKYVESNVQRDPGLSGVTWTGPLTGRPGLQKNVAAGTTHASSLTADATAFPGPDDSHFVVEVDRVLVTTGDHKPIDHVAFWWESPGHAMTGYGPVARFYFCGPAGSDGELVGLGQYCVQVGGDGFAELFERGYDPADLDKSDPIWAKRFEFIYEPSRQMSPTKTYCMSIVNDAWEDSSGKFHGSKIQFCVEGVSNTSVVTRLMDVAQNQLNANEGNAPIKTYTPPKLTDEPVQLAPIRIDMRRDVRGFFHVVKHRYPTTGSITDGVFSLDFIPTDDVPFLFEWYARSPTGTTVSCKLYDASDDTELAEESSGSDEFGGWRYYTPPLHGDTPFQQRHYYVKADFTSDGEHTPTLIAWRLFRDALTRTYIGTLKTVDDSRAAATGMPQSRVKSVSITDADSDPATNSATIVLNDLTGTLTMLAKRDNVPVKIQTTYDSGGTNKTILFRGYTARASGQIKYGDKGQSYPNKNWREWNIPCVGEWRRLQDSRCPKRFNFVDRVTEKPYKVTDVVDLLLSSAGYPSYMRDVPDLESRLWTTEGNANTIEPYDSTLDTCTRLLSEYLGAWMIFDENAGSYGMWRVLEQKTPPYTVLARFRPDHPGAGKLPHHDGAYGTDTSGAQTIVKTFIRRGTDHISPERPEGNCVCVIGGALGQDAAKNGQNNSSQLSQVVYNVRSYNFLYLASTDDGYPVPDVTDPDDFLGYYAPIYVLDPTLSTEEAVNWVARRVYEYACVGRKTLTFEAPLIMVTDSSDTVNTNPRRLRFYDIVEVWNWDTSEYDTYIVRSCNPVYTKDNHQYARYELVTTSNIDTIGAIPPVKDMAELVQRVFKAVVGLPSQAQIKRAAQKQFMARTSDWLALPEPTIAPIQVLDPADPDFGKFIATLDYDPLG